LSNPQLQQRRRSEPRNWETLCQVSRTKELPSSTNSPHTRTVLPRRTTGKKITRPDTSIPNKHWNIRIKLLSGRKKLIGSPRSQRRSDKGAWSRRTSRLWRAEIRPGVRRFAGRNSNRVPLREILLPISEFRMCVRFGCARFRCGIVRHRRLRHTPKAQKWSTRTAAKFLHSLGNVLRKTSHSRAAYVRSLRYRTTYLLPPLAYLLHKLRTRELNLRLLMTEQSQIDERRAAALLGLPHNGTSALLTCLWSRSSSEL
jgi:hypothetical protein